MNKNLKTGANNGFTFFELVVFVTLIGILAGLDVALTIRLWTKPR